ncbi:unnamed protein product [Ilex paraguariensis]|uniref:Uncharacterized protein n=1 Tax=Ilex paraguariensis TaxID=185542 RepID=A0ABC8SC25_9AQUA
MKEGGRGKKNKLYKNPSFWLSAEVEDNLTFAGPDAANTRRSAVGDYQRRKGRSNQKKQKRRSALMKIKPFSNNSSEPNPFQACN